MVEKLKLGKQYVICGSAGSGKTSYILNLLEKYQNEYDEIVICNCNNDPIYDFLKNVLVVEPDFRDIEKLGELDENKKYLVVFDEPCHPYEYETLRKIKSYCLHNVTVIVTCHTLYEQKQNILEKVKNDTCQVILLYPVNNGDLTFCKNKKIPYSIVEKEDLFC